MIGALTLSEKARLLELAGKENKIDYIQESHEEVMTLFDQVMEEITDYLNTVKPEEEEVEAPEVDENVAKALEQANSQE
jgi:predicted metal-binding transcription factor (methanogenesis marker protein 9)